MNFTIINLAGDLMFSIVLNGEKIETVMYSDYSDALNYALEEYGKGVKVEKIGDQMNVNLILTQFDELNDSEAMVLLFKNLKSIIVDNTDIIRVDNEALQVKSEAGSIVVDVDEINGFQVLEKTDIIECVLSNLMGDQMAKAELIENPTVQQETGLVNVDNVPDVNTAIKQWDAYQELCKGLLNETDYQEIFVFF